MFPVMKAESTRDFCIIVRLCLLRNTFDSKSYYHNPLKIVHWFELSFLWSLIWLEPKKKLIKATSWLWYSLEITSDFQNSLQNQTKSKKTSNVYLDPFGVRFPRLLSFGMSIRNGCAHRWYFFLNFFESELHPLRPVSPKNFIVYFSRTEILSYVITINC